jgi:hypothetical protein
MSKLWLCLLLAACAEVDVLPRDAVAPPTLTMTGPEAALPGAVATWVVEGGGLAVGDRVLLTLGRTQAPGPCPAFAGGTICFDIDDNLRVLLRTDAVAGPQGPRAVFARAVPSGGTGEVYLQAWRVGPSVETSNAVPLYVSSAPETRIFVTSAGYRPGTASWSGLDDADQICEAEAQAAGLPGSHAWFALLSTDGRGARDRGHLLFPLYNAGLDVVADDETDLWDGSIDAPILRSNGSSAFGVAYTGTAIDGTPSGSTSTQCANWTSSSGGVEAGRPNETDTRWTAIYHPNNPTNACSNALPIYCVLGTGCPEGTTPLNGGCL